MSKVRTVEEFSTRRKLRYGGPPDPDAPLSSATKDLSLSPRTNASFSPHKSSYGRDQDGNTAYFIEFNIGDFNFDEITIRAEDNRRLVVKGKSESKKGGKEEFSREFTRDFTLPTNVDPNSIKAQLDDVTRQLSLICAIKNDYESGNSLTESNSYGSSSAATKPIGSIKETAGSRSIDYEIFLGSDLKDGRSSIELTSYNTLTVKVSKSTSDSHGDSNLELKRQIKLPSNANAQNIEHHIKSSHPHGYLVVKVPLK